MKSKIEEIFKDVLGRHKSIPTLFTNDARENIKKLADIIQTVNLAKCTLFDLDLEEEGSVMYLTYLLQKEGIPFGICENVKAFHTNKIMIKCEGGKDCTCKGRFIKL